MPELTIKENPIELIQIEEDITCTCREDRVQVCPVCRARIAEELGESIPY